MKVLCFELVEKCMIYMYDIIDFYSCLYSEFYSELYSGLYSGPISENNSSSETFQRVFWLDNVL